MERRTENAPADGPGEAGAVATSAFARIAAVVCLVGVVVILLFLLFSGGDDYRYKMVFENASQLVTGNSVMIGGKPVGSVNEIELTDDGQALIDISIEQELHEGTQAMIRPYSLAGIANRYIAVSPGMNSEPALPDGATIGREDTGAPVDLDQVLNAFTPKTRDGLANFIKGQAEIYENNGANANKSYKYLHPALYTTNEVLAQINKDQHAFEKFIVSGAGLFTTLAEKSDELSSSITNADQAFTAIAAEKQGLAETLDRLPPTFRTANTSFVNLRAALDDLDSLVDTTKVATKDLTPFLKKAQPVVADSVPFFKNFRRTLSEPGPANDLGELTAILPKVGGRAAKDFPRSVKALEDFQPTAEFARPYFTEMVLGLSKLGQAMGYYDANGHYLRAQVSNLNLFEYNGGTGTLEAAPVSGQWDLFGPTRVSTVCPGGVVESAPDNSNPFYNPPWPSSGLSGDECDPSLAPPGP